MRRRVSRGKTRGAGRSAGRGAVAVGGVRQSGGVTTPETTACVVEFVKDAVVVVVVIVGRAKAAPLRKGSSTRRWILRAVWFGDDSRDYDPGEERRGGVLGEW